MSEVIQKKEAEFSQGEYRHPFPEDTEVLEIQQDHEKPYEEALDFLVPEGTLITAAREGVVIAVVDEHDQSGPDKKHEKYLNYVGVQHPDDEEMVDYCHLAQGSARVKKGEEVREGQVLGVVGMSGRTDALHIHFFVSRPIPGKPGKFVGLRPRFKGELKKASK